MEAEIESEELAPSRLREKKAIPSQQEGKVTPSRQMRNTTLTYQKRKANHTQPYAATRMMLATTMMMSTN
jgi:hypothetical protein